MIEIALRECRFGGSKNALIIHSHSVHSYYEMEKITRVFYSNYHYWTHAKLYHTVQEYYSWEREQLWGGKYV